MFRLRFVILLCLFFPTASYSSGMRADPLSSLAQKEKNLETFKKSLPPHVIRAVSSKDAKAKRTLSDEERLRGKEYLKLKEETEEWRSMADLQSHLITIYLDAYPDTMDLERAVIHDEAKEIVHHLFEGIVKLRESYKIGSPALMHNLLVGVGMKKRGLCKHWAEDILKLLEEIPHPHFTAYWADAHPRKVAEHNVAVLSPLGRPMEDGLVIDPWRSTGKPFWILVKKDHYPWKTWEGYNPK